MPFELPPLPYAKDALQPHISAETLDFHYGRHHQTYVTNLNNLTQGKPEASKTLEELIRTAPEGGLFNNAAQVKQSPVHSCSATLSVRGSIKRACNAS